MEEPLLEVRARRGRLALLFVLALVMAGLGFVALRFGRTPLSAAGGVAGLGFFGVIALMLLRRLFDDRPTLVVTRAGLSFHASPVAIGHVPWSAIARVGTYGTRRQRFLAFLLLDQPAFLAALPWWKRWWLLPNQWMHAPVLFVSEHQIDRPLEELVAAIVRCQSSSSPADTSYGASPFRQP